MSGPPLQIEQSGEHEYLVRVTEAENEVQFLIRAAPSVLAQLGFQAAQEAQVVTATAAFLLRRQLAEDLPDVVELDDVAARYDDYLDELTKGLS